jgi:hypothetical protein
MLVNQSPKYQAAMKKITVENQTIRNMIFNTDILIIVKFINSRFDIH